MKPNLDNVTLPCLLLTFIIYAASAIKNTHFDKYL